MTLGCGPMESRLQRQPPPPESNLQNIIVTDTELWICLFDFLLFSDISSITVYLLYISRPMTLMQNTKQCFGRCTMFLPGGGAICDTWGLGFLMHSAPSPSFLFSSC